MKEYIIKKDSNFIFDEKTWILDKKLDKRYVIFFDLNYWINLTKNQNNNMYKEILAVLIDLLAIKSIECCTLVTQIIEIDKKKDINGRKILTNFIDKMTNGLSIRHPQQLIELELLLINKIGIKFENQSIVERKSRGFAFTHLLCALGNGYFSLDFAGLNIEESMQWDMANTIFESVMFNSAYSIANFNKGYTDKLHIDIKKSFEKAFILNENIKKYTDILYQEMEGDKEILKGIFDRNPEYHKKFAGFNFNNSQNIEILPSLNTLSKLYTAFRSSGKKPSINDFYDLMYASAVLPYVDLYATDKFVKHLATEVTKLSDKYGTLVLAKDEEVLKELKKIRTQTVSHF